MKLSEHAQKLCPIARTTAVIGESWTLLILRNCFLGVRRFDDFQQQLGLTRHVLTDRLKTLVEHGVLHKQPYGERAGRYEYRLTEKGQALYPVILALSDWGNQWMLDAGEQPIVYYHKDCGEPARPVMHCSSCEASLQATAVEPLAGKSLKRLARTMSEQALTEELGYPAARMLDAEAQYA